MNRLEIITQFRGEILDAVAPYLISNELAIIYANEAQVEACRRARLLVDSSTDSVCEATVTSGNRLVPISPKVISIRRLRLSGETRPLARCRMQDMDEQVPGWDASVTPGTPTVAVLDYESSSICLHPIPSANGTVLMTVTRDPLAEMTADGSEPEIAERYHAKLSAWMRYRAFSIPDSDLYDPAKAAESLAEFESEFGKRVSAAEERFELENYNDVGER